MRVSTGSFPARWCSRSVWKKFGISFTSAMSTRFRWSSGRAGTSLSGQSITDGVLVDIGRHFRGVRVEELGKSIRVQPGLIGQQANDALRLYRAKIGPDPASINSCRLGGILLNNASGMCCGVSQNAYHTLRSLTFMLPSGTLIDTAQPDADRSFAELEPELYRGLLRLKQAIVNNPAVAARIRQKYLTKNTTGYGLNAFLDFDTAIDIFSHLLIGSEGTLAFVAEAVLAHGSGQADQIHRPAAISGFACSMFCNFSAERSGSSGARTDGPRVAALRGEQARCACNAAHSAAGCGGSAGGVSIFCRGGADGGRGDSEGRCGRTAVAFAGDSDARSCGSGSVVEDSQGHVPFSGRGAGEWDNSNYRGRGFSGGEPR